LIGKNHNTPNFALFDIVSGEEVLKLALENLENKHGLYYKLIKDYILNYEKTDEKIREKIKTLIIFIQEYAKINGEKKTMNDLRKFFNKLNINNYKNIYLMFYFICIKYSTSYIINEIENY